MADTANYAAFPRIGAGSVTTADTSRTAPTSVATVITATATASSGTRIDNIDIVPTGTTTATVVRLWIHDGTAYHLWLEQQIQANVPSSTNPVQPIYLSSAVHRDRFPLILPTSHSLRASVNDATAGGIQIIARAGDFS